MNFWRTHPVRNAVLMALTLSVSAAFAQTPEPAPALPEPVAVPSPSAPPVSLAPPQVPGAAWVLMDFESGQVLAEHNSRTPLDPASITKVMTAYVVADALAKGDVKADDEVFISERAW